MTMLEDPRGDEAAMGFASERFLAHPWLVHEHDWKLVAVEHEGSTEVREYACRGCLGVRFE
jgi:hypothetical protein